MKRQYFTDSNYKTDSSNIRSGIFNWLSRSRLIFTFRFIGVVLRSRKLAIRGRYDWDEWSRASIDIMRLLEKSGGEIQIEGFDNIRDLDAPVVFVSNHMSTFETMVFPCLIAPFIDVTFVVKDSLVNFPVFGPIMRSRNPVVVSRNNSREDLLVVLKDGSELLKSGTSIIVFPQSTRRTYLKISEFNSLGVKLASRNNVKVVPIAIKTDYWQNGKLVSELGPFDRSNSKIFIEFGTPLQVEGSGKETHSKVVNFISERLKLWNATVLD